MKMMRMMRMTMKKMIMMRMKITTAMMIIMIISMIKWMMTETTLQIIMKMSKTLIQEKIDKAIEPNNIMNS